LFGLYRDARLFVEIDKARKLMMGKKRHSLKNLNAVP
jgi:hypothetical protein